MASFSLMSMPEPPAYQYTTLQGPRSFRLLRISSLNTIICTIQDFDRNSKDCPPYTALSYAWGDASVQRHVRLNGVLFPVTTNLYEALKSLGDEFPSQYFWIDALCINQNNPLERGHQVAQMKEIYSEANQVVAWLDGGYKTISHGFIDHPEDRWDFAKVVRLPYWKRIWIVQELAVAKDLVFMRGHSLVRRADFTACLNSVYHTGDVEEVSRALYLVKTIRFLHQRGNAISLADALVWTGDSLASDPKDNVYGVLGLVGRGSGREIRADYTKSLCAVYREATCAMLNDWDALGSKARGVVRPGLYEIIEKELFPSNSATQYVHCADSIRLRQTRSHRLGRSLPSVKQSDSPCDGERCGLKSCMQKVAKQLQMCR